MEKIKDLKNKIFLVCYFKPRYIAEIEKAIYEKNIRETRVGPTIPSMLENNELKRCDIKKNNNYFLSTPELTTYYKIDDVKGRLDERKYFISTIGPVFKNIELSLSENKIKLNTDEEKQIKNILRSIEFRQLLENSFVKAINDYKINIDPIEYISKNLCIASSMCYSMLLAGFNKGFTKKQILQDWDKKSEKQIRSKAKNHNEITSNLNKINENISNVIEFKDAIKKIADLDFSLLKKLNEIYPESMLINSSIQIGKEIGK